MIPYVHGSDQCSECCYKQCYILCAFPSELLQLQKTAFQVDPSSPLLLLEAEVITDCL